MYKLVDKLESLVPYEPITGEYRIRLDANESFIRLPADIIAKAASEAALNRYPDPYCVEAINEYAKLYKLNPDLITAGNGSDELISIIISCFLDKKSKVMCFSPDFSMYSFYPYLMELDVDVVKKNQDLTIDVDEAIKYANDNKIDCIIFSNPCNPTSLGLDRDSVRKLIKGVKALVVLDEAYMDFWNQSMLLEIEDFDNVIILKTCSKALAMAGIRLGFAISSKRITTAMRAAKSPYNVNVITQKIAKAVLSDGEAIRKNIDALIASNKRLYEEIKALGCPYFEKLYEPVTNFVFIKTPQARAIYDYLLANSIAIRFMGDYLRITCGSDEENAAVIAALKNFKE